MRVILKYFIFLLTVSSSLLTASPIKVKAYFEDDFSSLQSLGNYTISPNSGVVSIEEGELILDSTFGTTQYPYVSLRSELISPPIYQLEITFRYSRIGRFGGGIVLDDRLPINGTNYDAGHNSIAWTWNWEDPPTVKLGRYSFLYSVIPDQTGIHTLRVSGLPGYYEVFLDNIFQGTTSSPKTMSEIWFGNPHLVGTIDSWPKIHIDSIKIWDSASIFPYYSQKDSSWKDEEYDSAHEWAGADNATIERWGCALTSVAMILDKYKVKMPDGAKATPLLLNQWLSLEPDGYIGNGLLNWLAISRLARTSRENGQAGTDLEFVKSYGTPSDEITAGEYPIINEGGHFVVTYDQDSDNYTINDPNNAERTSKAKSEQIMSVNTYSPSDTDLSYILLVTEPGLSTIVSGDTGRIGVSYEEYITDDQSGGESPKSYLTYIKSPQSGLYRIDLTNSLANASNVAIYGYSKEGAVVPLEIVAPSGVSSWEYRYDQSGNEAPAITLWDTIPPRYLRTTVFNGWYKEPQTAYFEFEDEHLPSPFTPPSCVIKTEGENQTCTVDAEVCDTYSNCVQITLVSNPANIDLTPPRPTNLVWGLGMRPYSMVGWSPSRDSVKYVVEWGEGEKALINRRESKENWVWLPTPKGSQIYVRVIAQDRAGNLSKPSKIEKIKIYPWYWRW